MKRRAFLLWSSALALPSGTALLAQTPVSDLESEVYTALVNRLTQEGSPPIVVVGAPTVSLKKELAKLEAPWGESIARRIPEATPAVVDSLVRMGEIPGGIRLNVNALRQGLNVQVAAEGRLREIFNYETEKLGNDWELFKASYKGANGIVRFSRVGSDLQSGQALVLVSFECGALCGSKFLVLMQRKANVWTVIKDHLVSRP